MPVVRPDAAIVAGSGRYDARAYWRARIAGDGVLANVGQAALGAYNRYTYPLRLAAFDRALALAGVKPHRVFDAGFGEGVYLEYWARRGVSHVAGLDFSERAVAASRRRHPEYDLRAGDLSSWADLRSFGGFDVVTAIDVLYHVVDDHAWALAVDNLLRLVSPGGAFLFSDKIPIGAPTRPAPHVRRRPLGWWVERVERAGLALRARVPVFVLMDDPIVSGSLPWLGRLARLQWRIGAKLVRLSAGRPAVHEAVAGMVARLQLPPERLLLRRLARTPNLEIVVCRRPSPHGSAAMPAPRHPGRPG